MVQNGLVWKYQQRIAVATKHITVLHCLLVCLIYKVVTAERCCTHHQG